MNTVIAPFHDWRKILIEGSRTRDAHFIEEIRKNPENITVVINRPTTRVEILLKRKPNLLKYEVIFKKDNFKLYRIDSNFYLVDFISSDVISQIKDQYLWFEKQYGNKNYINFINDALGKLGISKNYNLLNQNIFASKLSLALNPKISIFDAWDNFLKFDIYKEIKQSISQAYLNYGKTCDFWITNSNDNLKSFEQPFKPKKIYLIKNGVDLDRFVTQEENQIPEDLKNIPRPIIGFGGKISHLIDVELINKTMSIARSTSFVFVGQILNKSIYNSIKKYDNFYYLGDKHYDEYPNYVKNFDICIVPYVIEEDKKSGANSIKVYEYLATNKKVIGTNSNGLEDLQDYLYIVNNAEEFAEEVKTNLNIKEKINIEEHSWKFKISQLTEVLNAYK